MVSGIELSHAAIEVEKFHIGQARAGCSSQLARRSVISDGILMLSITNRAMLSVFKPGQMREHRGVYQAMSKPSLHLGRITGFEDDC